MSSPPEPIELAVPVAGHSFAPVTCYAASPALTQQSEGYPADFRGRVPKQIKMEKTLYPDEVCGISPAKPGTMLELDQVYDCWVNSHGAVAGWCDNGEKLGVKPGDFDVVAWHETKPQNSVLGGNHTAPSGSKCRCREGAPADATPPTKS